MTTTNVYGTVLTPSVREEIINTQPEDDVVGVLFPLFNATQGRGIFRKAKGMNLFRSMLTQFIKTERGERVMLPNFGLSLRRFLFSPMDDELVEGISSEIVYGLKRYLPFVQVIDLNVVASTDRISGFGLPGIRVLLSVSPADDSPEIVNLAIDL